MGDNNMNNETYNFKLEGAMYCANFAYTPSRDTVDNQQLFKGILNGNGNLINHYCIVRSNCEGTEESWQKYVNVRKLLKVIEQIFRSNNCAYTFSVPKSALATMEKAALPSKIASAVSRWRRPRKEERVLVDLYRYPHKETICTGPMFSAISHISLKESNGQSYLTNFRAFTFKTRSSRHCLEDTICITAADTMTDVAAFEKRHKCTELCMMDMPINRTGPLVIPKQGVDNGISYPFSAPACGDFHFWSREPLPPPYSEHPLPTAPPISFADSPFDYPDFFPRQYSIG